MSVDDERPRRSDLGLSRAIPRRDFLQGALVAASTLLTGRLSEAYAGEAAADLAIAQDQPGYYPPLLTGLRGNHPGSFEGAHRLRDGAELPSVADVGESYDLIVVGGGISGLAAAHFYRMRSPRAGRVLILDNHDDFGGHAKRNEFQQHGRPRLLMNGGTLEIGSPRPYSAVSAGLIQALGIDVEALHAKVENREFYDQLGLKHSIFFDRETFGADRLVVVADPADRATIAKYPLPPRARADIEMLEKNPRDFMPGLTSNEKKLRLSKISYRDFLRDIVRVDPMTIQFYQCRTHGWWSVGIDAITALDCWGIGLPGFQGMKLEPGSIPRMGFTPAGFADTGGSYQLHFPDGNASVARLLVRALIPSAVPGKTAEDVVTARVDYSKLDQAHQDVRLRLNSIAVRASNVRRGSDDGVEVTYMRGDKAYKVKGRHCILAGYNMMIPYLCPELPATQRSALHRLVKMPIVYTTVALRNWEPFVKLGIQQVHAPAGYHSEFNLNAHVNIGGYRSPAAPSEPILLHMIRTPCSPGLTEPEQNKAGRTELLATPFATFEAQIRDQLVRALSGSDFDPARDIEAIFVNRWPHGYAREYNPLFDGDIPEAKRDHVLGRARFGRIAIANSDAAGGAYTDAAIDQAHRAVDELLHGT